MRMMNTLDISDIPEEHNMSAQESSLRHLTEPI